MTSYKLQIGGPRQELRTQLKRTPITPVHPNARRKKNSNESDALSAMVRLCGGGREEVDQSNFVAPPCPETLSHLSASTQGVAQRSNAPRSNTLQRPASR